jgi:signal transduction histidine kinase
VSRILLLLENRENCRLLAALLGRRHELSTRPAPDFAFDLAIVDRLSLRKHAAFLQSRKAEEDPVLLPVLLAVNRDHFRGFTGAVFKLVDEVVMTPVEKVELSARVEMLLRARRLSLELRLRKDDLEAFIHAMTHDLRAPLRTVTGFAEAMAEEQSARLDPAGKHQLDRIQGAVRQMWELIESLMDFSRIGRKAFKRRPVHLDGLVREALEELHADIEARHAQVTTAGLLGEVEGDPALLKIAICNLISNGIKYVSMDVTPALEISLRRDDKAVLLLFRDNGIGMKPEDQERIFTPFVRLHGVEDYPGVGLGLAAVRKVVEIMGGQTGVTSKLGEGSTFWIELPVGSGNA